MASLAEGDGTAAFQINKEYDYEKTDIISRCNAYVIDGFSTGGEDMA